MLDIRGLAGRSSALVRWNLLYIIAVGYLRGSTWRRGVSGSHLDGKRELDVLIYPSSYAYR